MHQKILILDFGSQYSQLIARRVRELNVYCELHPNDVSNEFIKKMAPDGIILSGGPNSVWENDTPRAPDAVWDLAVILAVGKPGGADYYMSVLFTAIIAMLSIGGALAFGLGGRDAAAKFISKLREEVSDRG